MLSGLAALALTSAAHCAPVSGSEVLWLPSTRWVIIGEMHGTNEAPDAFANLVCLTASEGRNVTVALEYSSDWQPVIDRFMESDGAQGAREKLLTLPIWHSTTPDGRGSTAFLRLLDSLRQLKQKGAIASIICSDESASSADGKPRDAIMAENWKKIVPAEGGVVLAFVGNVHAMRHAWVRADGTIVTAASLLPPRATTTVEIAANGGEAWNCQADGCGVHTSNRRQPKSAGITLSTDPTSPWHARYELGRPTTASMPVASTQPAQIEVMSAG